MVSNDTRDFLPDSLQFDLHYTPHLYHSDGWVKWYRVRKGKPLNELQIEVSEWAIKKVEDAPGVAQKPRNEYIAAVRKEIESLKKSRKPVVDPSPGASPMAHVNGWKFYLKEDALAIRIPCSTKERPNEEFRKMLQERKDRAERSKTQKAAEAEQDKKK